MDHPTDRRDTRRLFVGPDHTIRFTLKGHAFSGIRITNLSVGGCFAVVSKRDTGLFTSGAILEGVCLEHPDLPKTLFTAQVRYSLGANPSQTMMEYLGIGIAFLSLPSEVQNALVNYLNNMLGPE